MKLNSHILRIKIDREEYWINHLFLNHPNYRISLRLNGVRDFEIMISVTRSQLSKHTSTQNLYLLLLLRKGPFLDSLSLKKMLPGFLKAHYCAGVLCVYLDRQKRGEFFTTTLKKKKNNFYSFWRKHCFCWFWEF